MQRGDVIEALHLGMAQAVRDFHGWTMGESIKDWGVESVLTNACARELHARMRRAKVVTPLTLEQDFGSILDFSERQRGPGRPTTGDAAVTSKPRGRVDIVLWTSAPKPRAIIEIKRVDGAAGLMADAARVCAFMRAAGRELGGSVRYGVVATIVDAARDRRQDLIAKARRRRVRMEAWARKHRFALDITGPREILESKGEGDRCMATLVFLFAPDRDV